MLLGAHVLQAVTSVNDFEVVDFLELVEGDTPSIFLRLVDLSQDRSSEGFQPAGRRYIPPATTTLQVQLDSIDSAKVVTRAATQPFAGDASIWSVGLLTTDKVPAGTITLRLVLTEPTRILRGSVRAALRVQSARG